MDAASIETARAASENTIAQLQALSEAMQGDVTQKTNLIAEYEAQIAALEAQIEEKSRVLGEKFRACPQYAAAKTIYGYLPYNQAVRTVPMLRQALLDGKQVAVPKVFGDDMKFILLPDLDAVAKGYAGIPEPIADGPEADDPHALVLMPGLVFDPRGHRIGYGGGFYDKFLSRERGSRRIRRSAY